MLDGKHASIREMNIERLEGPRLMHLLQLFNRHIDNHNPHFFVGQANRNV